MFHSLVCPHFTQETIVKIFMCNAPGLKNTISHPSLLNGSSPRIVDARSGLIFQNKRQKVASGMKESQRKCYRIIQRARDHFWFAAGESQEDLGAGPGTAPQHVVRDVGGVT